MRRLTFVVAVLIAWVVGSGMTYAQVRQPRVAAVEVLRPEAQARVVLDDTLLHFRTRPVPNGRLDVDAGVLRAAYRIDTSVPTPSSPEQAARDYLSEQAEAFGWPADGAPLELASVRSGRYSSHVTFQQVVHGLPVYHRTVKVNLDREGQPTMAISGYAPHLDDVRTFDPTPSLAASAAATHARQLVEGPAEVDEPELVVYPSAVPRLAWRMQVYPQRVPAAWEVVLDARNGDVIQLLPQTTHAHEHDERKGGIAQEKPWSRSPALQISAVQPTQTRVDGSGFVFDPDPLTSAGVAYGAPYVDGSDSDASVLNAELVEVPLRDITLFDDGLYRLQGPHVRIVDNAASVSDVAYTPPAESQADGFRYNRAHDGFEAVMAYYHIDQNQRYIQSLEVGHSIRNAPVTVNPQGLQSDDSKYFLSEDVILYGTGGVDDAEDADVILHEYGHALLESSAPGLFNSFEGKALHEGWSDYWAASYSRALAEAAGDGGPKRTDWENIFQWDSGDGQFWAGRSLNHAGRYPRDLVGNIYVDGTLWATTLMEIYDDLGRQVTDRLTLASHSFLSAPATMRDAAEALIQADIALYDGQHLGTIIPRLEARGFVEATEFGPSIAHDPERDAHQTNDAIVVEATLTAREGIPITDVKVHYQLVGSDWNVFSGLEALEGTQYRGELALPPLPGIVRYYFAAEDRLGRRTLLPATAPAQTFQLEIGTVETISALEVARPGLGWRSEGTAWAIRAPDISAATQASLVLERYELPDNAGRVLFMLEHVYVLQEGAGGQVQLSSDGGRSWTTLTPEAGYPGERAGAPVFTGISDSEGAVAVFDLSDYAGQQVQLRLDFGTERGLQSGEFWAIRSGTLQQATLDDQFEVGREIALHPSFPNPFADNTTISFTLPVPMQTTLELYDVLGRQVAVLVDEAYNAGTHTLTLSRGGLAGGVYFMRLRAGGTQHVERIVVAR